MLNFLYLFIHYQLFMIHFALSLLLGTSLAVQPLNTKSLSDTIKNKEIKEVTIVGGLSGNFAMPLTVVGKSTLETNSFNTPADALQREAGISLSRDGIWGTSVNVRGLSEQRLLFLVDGDRIQTSSDIAAALSTVDMASLEKIEVVKGASSVLYGTGAMGGIVNFVSSRPTYSETFKTTGKISSGFNTVNNLWDNNANLNFTTNQWYLALTGSFRTAQNAQSPKGEVFSSQFHDASWGVKAGIKYAPNEEFLVNYQHVGAWDVGIPGVSAFPAIASVRYKKVDRNQLSGEYIITDINDNLQKLSLKVYKQNIARDVEVNANPTSTTFPKALLLPSSLNSTTGAKLTTNWELNPKQSLILGAEGWFRKSETARLKVVTASDTLFSVFGEQPVANARQLDLGAFAHYSLKVIPTKLTLNAGLRLDFIRTENDSAFNPVFKYVVKNGTRTDITNLTRTNLFLANVVPEFGYAAHIDLVYNVTRSQSLALSFANSYRAASIDERFKYIDLGAITRVGNPDLKPEKGTFANLNYTFASKVFQLKTDVFANYLSDLITEKAGTYLGRTALINTNINKALFWGAELEANWNINRSFSLLANAAYTHSRDVDANSPLPQIPPMSGFASLNYHSGGLLEASFSTLWAAKQGEVAAGETPTDGHIIYNLDVHSTPIQLNNAFLQLFAGADNLLNTAYYNHLTTVRVGGLKYYEPGRNIYVKARLNF
jgi:hemoglobin/transferrin/lactoferrin receptor protein